MFIDLCWCYLWNGNMDILFVNIIPLLKKTSICWLGRFWSMDAGFSWFKLVGAKIANHWFRSGLRSMDRESFDSDQDFGVWIANHLIQIRTSEYGSWIIWFRSGLRSMDRESFDSDQDFGVWIVNHLIQIRTSEYGSWIIWFRSGLWSTDCELFDSDQDFGAQIANYLIQIRTSEHRLRIIWFR